MLPGHETCENSIAWRWTEARPAVFQKIALGSLATATNASPIPTARAPTPILRKVPDEVPVRCSPRLNWARAGAGTSAASARTASSGSPALRHAGLEVVVKLQPPLDRRTVVRRVVDLRDPRVVVDEREVAAIVRADPPHPAESGDRIDAVDHVGVEDVETGEAQVEPPAPEGEDPVDAQVGGGLERRVARIGLAVCLGERIERRVGAARLALDVEVEPHVPEPAPALGRLLVEAQVEADVELVGPVPAHEGLGQRGLRRVAAVLLDDLLRVGIAALAQGLLEGVAHLARPVGAAALLELDLEALGAREVAVEVDEVGREALAGGALEGGGGRIVVGVLDEEGGVDRGGGQE